jgi:hypothetical protein
MEVRKKDRLIFRSMEEFRSKYFPNDRKSRTIVKTSDEARALGAKMAREAMKQIKIKSNS